MRGRMPEVHLAKIVMQRIEALAQITDVPGNITRTFASPAMRRANDLVASWMREAGMKTRVDAIGNLVGHYDGAKPGAKILLIGSHLDTVFDAGKFDGALGVVLAIACVQRLHETKTRLPFAVEVIGFADEEGVRYQNTYLGSRALAGTFDTMDLTRTDASGITMTEAIRKYGGNPDALTSAKYDASLLLGYVEVHIEQGPVLEKKYQPIGVVTAIAGQTRIRVRFIGEAAHAGTTPMALRRDALVAAARFVMCVEMLARDHPGIVATVGQIEAKPGASNVIPGEVILSLDVRHQEDASRKKFCERLKDSAEGTGKRVGIEFEWQVVQETPAVACARELSELLKGAARRHVDEIGELPSGAGHDAAAMSAICDVAMLFVRCKGGISHNPSESASEQDVQVAFEVMNDFLQLVAQDHA
jgi:allantoate deiminase